MGGGGRRPFLFSAPPPTSEEAICELLWGRKSTRECLSKVLLRLVLAAGGRRRCAQKGHLLLLACPLTLSSFLGLTYSSLLCMSSFSFLLHPHLFSLLLLHRQFSVPKMSAWVNSERSRLVGERTRNGGREEEKPLLLQVFLFFLPMFLYFLSSSFFFLCVWQIHFLSPPSILFLFLFRVGEILTFPRPSFFHLACLQRRGRKRRRFFSQKEAEVVVGAPAFV